MEIEKILEKQGIIHSDHGIITGVPIFVCIFTFNIRDFLVLAQSYTQHHGIILAAQSSWTISDLISALDRLLSEKQAVDWIGQVRWLNQWRR